MSDELRGEVPIHDKEPYRLSLRVYEEPGQDYQIDANASYWTITYAEQQNPIQTENIGRLVGRSYQMEWKTDSPTDLNNWTVLCYMKLLRSSKSQEFEHEAKVVFNWPPTTANGTRVRYTIFAKLKYISTNNENMRKWTLELTQS